MAVNTNEVINVSLPNLLEKCYTLGTENLSELEKFIYSMLEENITKLDKIMSSGINMG